MNNREEVEMDPSAADGMASSLLVEKAETHQQTTNPMATDVTTTMGESSHSIGDLQFVCEGQGYRYYKNAESKQYCLDSLGNWFLFDEQTGVFVPMPVKAAEQPVQKAKASSAYTNPKLKNVERFGIKFDHNGRPVFPKNEKGNFVLPRDERGLPFFPVDDRGKPIFPYDIARAELTFPVDDTEEPIFYRNEQNKPIVPCDRNGDPIFPKDKAGSYIFPMDENNCPTPALTTEGVPVIPKDVYGNFVIPRDRDGKPLVHIAPDGVTPISAAEWKLYKKALKNYKEQTRAYHQHQQQQQIQSVSEGTTNPMHSMFHPLNLEQQQSVYFASDLEMLQRTRRVRPEDVDLPNMYANAIISGETGMAGAMAMPNVQNGNGTQEVDERQQKRKKLLEAQLKSVKMVIPPAPAKKSERKKEREEKKATTRAREIDKHKRSVERRHERSRSRKRRHSSDSSRGRYRRRSPHSRSRSPRRNYRRRQRRVRTPSSSSSSSSNSSSATVNSSSSASNSKIPRNNGKEEEIRNRIITRTLASNNLHEREAQKEPEEYGPQPPTAQLYGSDMEMSDDEVNASEGRNSIPAKGNVPLVKNNEQIYEAIVQQEQGKDGQLVQEEHKCNQIIGENDLQGPFNVKEVLKSDNLHLVRLCKKQEREKYDQIKLKIAELEVARSIHKRNWAQLGEVEKQLEGKHGVERLSPSDDES